MSALDRVRAVVRAGRRAADPFDAVGREARERLPSVTGLAAPLVESALAIHLETKPSDEELATLLSRAGSAPRCHVVLSANVCTAALRAIAVACATAPRVVVKPSRRDPVLAELLVRALGEDAAFAHAGGSIALAHAIVPEPGDEVHVYGADATIEAIRPTLPAGVTLRAHGTGFGVAIFEEGVDLDLEAHSLARDVVSFDQRGCLSARIAIVIGVASRAARAMRATARELAEWNEVAPRGALAPEDEADLRRYLTTVTALGASLEGPGFAVGLDEAPRSLLLPPAARAVHFAPATIEDLARLIAPWASKIAAIGVAPGAERAVDVRALAPRARISRLGHMQLPPLDGPVDLRDDAPFKGPEGPPRSPSPAPDR